MIDKWQDEIDHDW